MTDLIDEADLACLSWEASDVTSSTARLIHIPSLYLLYTWLAAESELGSQVVKHDGLVLPPSLLPHTDRQKRTRKKTRWGGWHETHIDSLWVTIQHSTRPLPPSFSSRKNKQDTSRRSMYPPAQSSALSLGCGAKNVHELSLFCTSGPGGDRLVLFPFSSFLFVIIRLCVGHMGKEGGRGKWIVSWGGYVVSLLFLLGHRNAMYIICTFTYQ